jgi:fructoselysine-6-P-deglycase FrlB-like protein
VSAGASGAPMLADIRRQPECLARLLARTDDLARLGTAALTPGPGGRLYAVGSGDGWFAARAVSESARRGLGLRYRAASSMEFLAYLVPRLTDLDRVILISMSGNVDRTVEAGRAVRARGVSSLVLTNGAGGRLAEGAREVVSLDIPELAPFLSGTSTYTGTVLALLLLLRGVRPATERRAMTEPAWRPAIPPLAAQLEALPALIADADRAATAVAACARDRGISGVRILAVGPHLASAEYGAAKLVELTRLPVWSDDVEEFAHRQFWSAGVQDLVVYLVPNAAVVERVTEAAPALAALGLETLAIETGGGTVPTSGRRLELPATPEWLAALVLPVPLQLLAYHLARATGLDPDTRAHLRDDRVRFRVSRQLTRRSLVDTGR